MCLRVRWRKCVWLPVERCIVGRASLTVAVPVAGGVSDEGLALASVQGIIVDKDKLLLLLTGED